MKTIKGSKTSDIWWGILFILLCVFVLIKSDVGLLVSILMFICVVLIYLISLSRNQHYFLHDTEQLKIKNSWKPQYDRIIIIKDLKKVEIINAAYYGLGIKFTFRNGRKEVYHTNASRKTVNEMISEINQVIIISKDKML